MTAQTSVIGPQPSMLDHALAYARHGWPVFPLHDVEAGHCSCGDANCKHPGKHPRTKHGYKDASTDEAMIQRWWTRWHNANIGLPTGHVSGLVVLDSDGDKGAAMLAAQTAQHGPLPPTLQAETGRGVHYWFALPRGVSVPSIARDGLDVRGDGGYVVVPPSMHASGKRYRWIGEHTAPAAMPDWIAHYTHCKPASVGTAPPSSPAPRASISDRILNEQHSPGPWSEVEEARIRSALNCIRAEAYDTWLHIGMALHRTGWGERALLIYDGWSRTVPEKYKDADVRKK